MIDRGQLGFVGLTYEILRNGPIFDPQSRDAGEVAEIARQDGEIVDERGGGDAEVLATDLELAGAQKGEMGRRAESAEFEQTVKREEEAFRPGRVESKHD